MIRKTLLSMLAVGVGISTLLALTATPVNSVSTVSLRGSASNGLSLSAGSTQTMVTSATSGSSSVTVAADTTNFTETFNFGDLTTGDGTNATATVTLRERGNVPCHVSWSIPTYTTSTIAYNGTTLNGGAGNGGELTFLSVTPTAVSQGANGAAAAAHTYGWAGTVTLASQLSGTVGSAVATNSPTFCSFSSRPSLSGSLTSADNWFQDGVVFSVPTGLAWSPSGGAASGSWQVDVQFEIYAGP